MWIDTEKKSQDFRNVLQIQNQISDNNFPNKKWNCYSFIYFAKFSFSFYFWKGISGGFIFVSKIFIQIKESMSHMVATSQANIVSPLVTSFEFCYGFFWG
jgi:hypothetical protein